MKYRRRLKLLLWVVMLGLIGGCAQLPDYARPRFHVPENGAAASRDGFSYRPLTVEDFQAASLPPEYSEYDHHINAHSCISIRPTRDTKVRITQGTYGAHSFYVGSIPHIVFEAIFVPACSWWNPEVPEPRITYVLEHEQIHFALAEIAARKLTRDAREVLKDYLAINNSYPDVQEELKTKIRDMAHAAMESGFEEHTDFDKDTSLYHDPRAQRWWLQEVEARLAETAP